MNFRSALTVLIVFLLLAGTHLFIYAQNISLKYKLTDIKIKIAEVNSANRILGSQVARAENLPEIEKIARDKLGMIYPENMNYIIAGKAIARTASEETSPGPN